MDQQPLITENLLDLVLQAIDETIHLGNPTRELPEYLARQAQFQQILATLMTLQQFALSISNGDLEQTLRLKGVMAGSLKSLQASLRHLTWQTQQIAKGDFSQRVEFMGEFSAAFNDMVTALAEARSQLEQREAELSQANADLLHEIGERKQAEIALLAAHNELQEKNRQLRELNASKDKFFSIIAHDLRSPFTALIGYTKLLAERVHKYSPEELKTNLEKMSASAERTYALLENLLTWSRIQRGAMDYVPEWIDLSEIVEDTIALNLSNAERKQIVFEHLIPAGLMVYADHNMATTVLRNLTSNALKFTPAGGSVTISARRDMHAVEVIVSDTGPGIKPETIAKLFRIDVSYTTSGTAGEKGTGLGLVLCQELIARHGGAIRVESEVGHGSRFIFTLPNGE